MYFKSFIACALVCFTACLSVSVNEGDGQGFLETILQYYGENKSISTENLEDLLQLISARRPASITQENPLENKEVSN